MYDEKLPQREKPVERMRVAKPSPSGKGPAVSEHSGTNVRGGRGRLMYLVILYFYGTARKLSEFDNSTEILHVRDCNLPA